MSLLRRIRAYLGRGRGLVLYRRALTLITQCCRSAIIIVLGRGFFAVVGRGRSGGGCRCKIGRCTGCLLASLCGDGE